MTDRFQILIEPRPDAGDAATRRLAIRLGDAWLTRLVRRGSDQPDRCLEAPPLPLAFWFLDNWWRIRCEPPPPQRDFPAHWRIAHHLPSVGAGYPWPNVSLWGEGYRYAVMVHADAHNLQRALRFDADPGLEYVPSSTAERAIDTFIDHVLQDTGPTATGSSKSSATCATSAQTPTPVAGDASKPCLASTPTTPPKPSYRLRNPE